MSRISCDECSRADVLRAVAGRGLPEIEAGMPVPAGTGLTRRSFVARSLGLALSVYGAGRLQLFDEGIAAAASTPGSPILVTVFLQGGADALSMLYPDGDPLYRKLRPQLAVGGGSVFAEDNRLHWHPALSPLAQLHGEGKVSVLPAVGYDHPDQSHFTSRHFWEVGATDTSLLTGWMGRYLDVAGAPDNPLQGLSLTGQLQPTLATAKVPVADRRPRPVQLLGTRRLGRGRGADAGCDRNARPRRLGRPGVPLRRERDGAGRPPATAARAVQRQGGHHPRRHVSEIRRLVPEAAAGSRRDGRCRPAAALRGARGNR
jgi:hypothetical protein